MSVTQFETIVTKLGKRASHLAAAERITQEIRTLLRESLPADITVGLLAEAGATERLVAVEATPVPACVINHPTPARRGRPLKRKVSGVSMTQAVRAVLANGPLTPAEVRRAVRTKYGTLWAKFETSVYASLKFLKERGEVIVTADGRYRLVATPTQTRETAQATIGSL